MRRLALRVLPILVALCAYARGDDLLLRARHAQLALGDLPRAIELYREALSGDTLTQARKAEAHLRLAICYHESKLPEEAKLHLAKRLYEGDDVPRSVWRKATELRAQIKEAEPKPAKVAPPRVDVAAQRARQLAKSKARARRFLRDNDVARAQFHVQRANEIAPDDPEVAALAAEVETRLSGVMEFLQAPLRFASRWTASRIRTVAKEAETLLRQALVHGSRGKINLAERDFRDSIAHIDACEFAPDAYELIELRTLVREHWRNLRRKHFGDAKADPILPAAPRRASLLAEYINHLQRMIDSVSSADREYRIVPVARPRARKRTRSRIVPPRLALTERRESAWTPALFASRYLPRRIHPASWTERGNYLEAAGGMLIARNRPRILDDLQKAVRRLEKTAQSPLDTRFVVVAVLPGALDSLARQYGAFRIAARGDSPLAYRVVRKFSLEHICGFLRDEGADVKFKRDLFRVSLDNATAQSLFISRPSKRYGLQLDAFPLREKDGGTALALKVVARHPAPPISNVPMRFLSQSGELFADIPPGATLIVGGIVNPFSSESGGELLLLWEGRPGTAEGPAVVSARGVEISLRKLLLEVRDNPGPRSDKERGFIRREPLDVLRERARFLELLLRDGLGSDAIEVDAEQAVAFIPHKLRPDDATTLLTVLERESSRSYVIRVIARSVRTKAFEHWLALEKLRLTPFGKASIAMRKGTAASVLRRLVPFERDEVFAPAAAWPAATTFGLQCGHCLHGRLRTSPSYTHEDDLAAGATRIVTEGTRVSVRPYTWRGELRAWIEVEVAGLQAEVEEVSLTRAVPSYRTKVAGMRVSGDVSLGSARDPKTAVVCRIPHPTASTLETLTELVIVVSIRPAQ